MSSASDLFLSKARAATDPATRKQWLDRYKQAKTKEAVTTDLDTYTVTLDTIPTEEQLRAMFPGSSVQPTDTWGELIESTVSDAELERIWWQWLQLLVVTYEHEDPAAMCAYGIACLFALTPEGSQVHRASFRVQHVSIMLCIRLTRMLADSAQWARTVSVARRMIDAKKGRTRE